YGKRYLARPEVVALDPFHLPLSTRPQKFTKLKGIPGAVRDASPDAWAVVSSRPSCNGPKPTSRTWSTSSTGRTMALAT
ncbi:MAG TPA: hypothetical protein VGM74_15275, partial [Burkholderiaceae bacterium]